MLSAQEIKQTALHLGFAACGLARATAVSPERAAELRAWLVEGCQGEMDYLARHVEKKLDPRLLVEGAQTVVSLAVNYYPGDHPTEASDEHSPIDQPLYLARYAYGTDYHEVVKGMLRELMQALGQKEPDDGRCFVDTAPVDEKYWAVQAGLGWRGRNSQLILPGMGSYFFLGELILTHEADRYDQPLPARCGSCRACLEACPTQALRGDGTMDARRCLSYLSIEYRGELPKGTGEKMRPCIYGCDRCAAVCPWNIRFAQPTPIAQLQPRPALLQLTPTDWQNLTLEDYRTLFRKSAVKRVKYEGLLRNIVAVYPKPHLEPEE